MLVELNDLSWYLTLRSILSHYSSPVLAGLELVPLGK